MSASAAGLATDRPTLLERARKLAPAIAARAETTEQMRHVHDESLHELIEGEGVTFTGGVPTIWTTYLAYLETTGQRPAKLKRVVIGGSAVPRAMAERFKSAYGVETLQIWGMTETCPLGVIASSTPALAALGDEEMQETIWSRQGRLPRAAAPAGESMFVRALGRGIAFMCRK